MYRKNKYKYGKIRMCISFFAVLSIECFSLCVQLSRVSSLNTFLFGSTNLTFSLELRIMPVILRANQNREKIYIFMYINKPEYIDGS